VAPGVRIGEHAQVEPGAVVTRDVPPNAVVQGHPAVITGYVDAPARLPYSAEAPAGSAAQAAPGVSASVVRGVQLHHLREVQDMRGFLCAAEFDANLPFVPRRCFWVYAVPNQQIRGEHAHRRCAQFLVAVTGRLRVVADDGERREEFWLDRPHLGLYLPPMTWGIQYGYSEDAVLMVLASDPYEPQDYIRDYAEFQHLANAARQETA
ncbi:MAG: WxcM-like domain-containing protein, partial [Ottowia sp.]|uniref:WxcM-like domain-containing protein n=1 Tax=Ottowia sp. TaxID=1898956 RepID=UPI003C74F7E9